MAIQIPLLPMTMRIFIPAYYRTRRVVTLKAVRRFGRRERIGAFIVRRKIEVPVDFGSSTDGFGIAENP